MYARGFWELGTDFIIDRCTQCFNQPSCLNINPANLLKSVEMDKKKKHSNACLGQLRHFTPFVASCEGLLGKEASTFLKRLRKNYRMSGTSYALQPSALFELSSLSTYFEQRISASEALVLYQA